MFRRLKQPRPNFRDEIIINLNENIVVVFNIE